jgi:hypothetical protein
MTHTPVVAAAALALFLAGPAYAQTVELTVDLAAIGIEAGEATLIDTDGNRATEEWLLSVTPPGFLSPYAASREGRESPGHPEYRYQVVAIRGNVLCRSAWHTLPEVVAGRIPTLQTRRGRTKLVFQGRVSGPFSVPLVLIALDTPSCSDD